MVKIQHQLKLRRYWSLGRYYIRLWTSLLVRAIRNQRQLRSDKMGDARWLQAKHLRKTNQLTIGLCSIVMVMAITYDGPAETIFSMNYASQLGAGNGAVRIDNSPPTARPEQEAASPIEGEASEEERAEVAPEIQRSPGDDINNRYVYGHCTWHVANLRAADGHPIPGNWGNAANWGYRAERAGYTVNNSPQPGAIAWRRGGYGHVAYVVGVEGQEVRVKEMFGFIANGVPKEGVYDVAEFSGYIH